MSVVCFLAMPLGKHWTSLRMGEANSHLRLSAWRRADVDTPEFRDAMRRAFADPAYNAVIDRAIGPVIYGMAAGLFGVVLAVINVGLLNYRVLWYWWTLVLTAVFWVLCWGVPFGQGIGATALIYLLWRRHTFRPAVARVDANQP